MSKNSPKERSSSTMLMAFGKNYFHNMGSTITTKILEHQAIDGTSQVVQAFEFDDNQSPPPWEEDDDPLVDVQCTISSTFFLTKSGKVYTCGTLHGTVVPNVTRLVITLPLKCEQIATGRHFCLAKMEGGLAVCSWGAGHFGQLGLGSESSPWIEHPTVVEALLPHVVGAPIEAVAAGYWHSMAVTQAGHLFAFGCNRNGQCASKPTKEPPTICSPQPVSFDPIISASTGKATTTSSGTSTSSSSSSSGHPSTRQQQKQQRAIQIQRIAAGRSHSVALDQSGQVYCWGANQYGQCGVITRRRVGGVAQVKHVEALAKVKIVRIAAGECHTLALTGGGRIFAWGGGFEGQLGTSSGVSVFMNPKPKLVGDLDFLAVEAGREWKAQQKEDGGGMDDSSSQLHPQPPSSLSTAAGAKQHVLAKVPRIISVHAKGNSSMAISNVGHVYAWGCNDVGNLGLPKPDPATLAYVDPGGQQPSHKTTTLRTIQTYSFDSSHNVALPQRLDSLRPTMYVTAVGMSPTFLWCLGTKRTTTGQDDDPEIGRTLYEIQEVKRQRSTHIHYERVLTTVDKGSFAATAAAPQHESASSSNEMKSTYTVSKTKNGDASTSSQQVHSDPTNVAAKEENGIWEDGSMSHHSEGGEADVVATTTAATTTPKTKKRLFSPKKLMKGIMRRASGNNTAKNDSTSAVTEEAVAAATATVSNT